MVSLFAQLFLALQDQIKNNVTEIAYSDQDLGQLEAYDTRPSVSWPCVLIDFPQAQYTDQGDEVQWADISVCVRLGFAPFSSANSLAPDITKEAALQYYELEHKLYKALQGFTADDCIQPLRRRSATTEKREDTFRIRELIFTTATEDDAAEPVSQLVAAVPKFSFDPL